MKKSGIRINNMKTGFKYEYAEVLTNIFRGYNIFVTKEGIFVDMTTRKYLRYNHLKCMLRNDYIKSGHGELTGKILCSILDRYLKGIKNAAAELADYGETEHTGYFEVEEVYL